MWKILLAKTKKTEEEIYADLDRMIAEEERLLSEVDMGEASRAPVGANAIEFMDE